MIARLIPVIVAGLLLTSNAHGTEFTVSNQSELIRLFENRVDSVIVHLLPGTYDLNPRAITDSTCGNCEDPSILVACTVGLHIRGGFVHLQGPPDRSAVIRTHAGYGLFIDNCRTAIIENLTITGGERDTSGLATDAAIVAKHSHVEIRRNIIEENIGDSATVSSLVVGIMGICGREGSRLVIADNEIIRNSWDGIALLRGAQAEIGGNLIDGVDKARGSTIGGGRGVGIGVTWDAKATIRGNLVKRYWKGIGLFVDADGVVENNVVEDIITWGISLWDAGKGAPRGFIRRNIIYKTGACGASITRSEEEAVPGEFVDNIIVQAAQNPKYDSPDYYCYQCALALHALPAFFKIDRNIFYNNRRATTDLPDRDLDKAGFMRSIGAICHSLAEHPVLQRADFLREVCFKE